jgi:hypothetical protein
MGVGIDGLIETAHEVGKWPYAVGHLKTMPVVSLLLMVCGMTWFCFWDSRRRLLGLLPILIGSIIHYSTKTADIYADGHSGLFAFKGSEGKLIFSNKRGSKYIKETWLKNNGEEKRKTDIVWSRADPLFVCTQGDYCTYSCGTKKATVIAKMVSNVDYCSQSNIVLNLTDSPITCPPHVKLLNIKRVPSTVCEVFLCDKEKIICSSHTE